MAEILLEDIRNHALKGITLTIPEGRLFALLGPSGAGKTTLLQVIAGLVPYLGRVHFNGKCVDNLPPFKRKVGYLFQDLLLFPHLSAKKNILLAMEHLGLSKEERIKRADEILKLLEIAHLAHRLPGEMSGGEKQRVALARAISTAPKILLLDEPFISLDYRTARYLRLELKRYQRQLKITTLFVTHNLEEAQDLGDRIAIIRDGMLEQVGHPDDLLLETERDKYVFPEKPNLLSCTDQKPLGNGLIEMHWAGIRLFVPDEGKGFDRVAIHPQQVYISRLPPPGPEINRFHAMVRDIRQNAGMAKVSLEIGDEMIEAEMSQDHLEALRISIGDPVFGILKLRALHGC